MRYPLPKDTVEILNYGVGNNPGLALDKFRKVGQDWKITDDSKKRSDLPAQVSTLITNALKRHKEMLKSITGRPKPYFEATTDYRLVVGFGAEHVLETNLYLHRIYGFPLIPGSAAKGVARAYAFWQIAQHLELTAADRQEMERRESAKALTPLKQLDALLSDGEAEGLAAEDKKQLRERQEKMISDLKEDPLCRALPKVRQLDFEEWQKLATNFYRVFGTTRKQGQVTFFDAYPTEAPRLKTDILNPHFGDYYGSKEKTVPPADYGKPIPSFFLTVDKGSRFLFAVASRDNDLTNKANEWLKGGLTELGIGSKTAAGYGFMKSIS